MKVHERNISCKIITIITIAILITVIPISAYADNLNFLNISEKCKKYLVDHSFRYHKSHSEYPVDYQKSKIIDCSGYVGWCIYEYQEGNFECQSSKWYLKTAKQLYQGKESDLPEYTEGWIAIKGSENYKPGDILCYNGHVHIYYGPSNDEFKPYSVLNAGSNKALKSCITTISQNYFEKAQYAIRLP